jgi:hypothetical protein
MNCRVWEDRGIKETLVAGCFHFLIRIRLLRYWRDRNKCPSQWTRMGYHHVVPTLLWSICCGCFGKYEALCVKHVLFLKHPLYNKKNNNNKLKTHKHKVQRKTQQNKTNCKNNTNESESSITMLILILLLKNIKYLLISRISSITG